MREQSVDFSLPCTPDSVLAFQAPPPPTPATLETPAPPPTPAPSLTSTPSLTPAPSPTLAPSSCSEESPSYHSWDTDYASSDPFDDDESNSKADKYYNIDSVNREKKNLCQEEPEPRSKEFKRNAIILVQSQPKDELFNQNSSKSSGSEPSTKSFHLNITKHPSQEDGEDSYQKQYAGEQVCSRRRITRYEYGKHADVKQLTRNSFHLDKIDNQDVKLISGYTVDKNKPELINSLTFQTEKSDNSRILSASKLLEAKHISPKYEASTITEENVAKKDSLFVKNSSISSENMRSGKLFSKNVVQGKE